MKQKQIKQVENGIVSTWVKIQLINLVIVFGTLALLALGFYCLCMVVKHNAGF